MEHVFVATKWGRGVVVALARYGLPEGVRIDDPRANPWRVSLPSRHTSTPVVLRMLVDEPMRRPRFEVERACRRDEDVVRCFDEALDTQYCPASPPYATLLTLYSWLHSSLD